jgi:cystathionine beta-synthase
VVDGEEFVGSLNDTKVLKSLLENPAIKNEPVSAIMEAPFQFVGMDNTIDVLSSLIQKDRKALMIRDAQNNAHILTQSDLLMAISE